MRTQVINYNVALNNKIKERLSCLHVGMSVLRKTSQLYFGVRKQLAYRALIFPSNYLHYSPMC